MVKVTWERYDIEGKNGWELKHKSFETQAEASRFIDRIRENVQVQRIWCLTDLSK